MNAESLYLTITNLSNIILACYKKLAILEIKGLESSPEYEKILRCMELYSKLEDGYYDKLFSDKKLEEEFMSYIGHKFDDRHLRNYATGYYRLFHEFPNEELVNVRMFSRLSTMKSVEVVKEVNPLPNIDSIVDYLFERKNHIFLDVLEDDIDNPNYKSVRNVLIKAKYDQAFMMKKKEVTCEVSQEEIECVGIGNDIHDVETLGLKLSKLSDKTIEHNYRSVILNIAYIKSALIQCHPFLVYELIDRFEKKLDSKEVSDTPGYRLFMGVLDSIPQIREQYLITDATLKRKL